jgi:hypothetical protein
LRESSEPTTAGGRMERFEGDGQTLAIYRPRSEGRSRTPSGSSAPALRPASRSVPALTSPTPAASWNARNSRPSDESTPTRNVGVRDGNPLILRGPQPSALRESVPPSSLVIVGGRNRAVPAPSQPSAAPAASTASAQPARPTPSAPTFGEWARTTRPAEDFDDRVPQRRPAGGQYQNQRPDWRGTVSSSPQPSWFRGNGAPASAAGGHSGLPEARSYQPVQRAPAAEVPRYAPSYTPQRSYSAPSWSAPARQNSSPQSAPAPQPSMSARPAPSAPSAPSASSGSHSSSSSSRNGR